MAPLGGLNVRPPLQSEAWVKGEVRGQWLWSRVQSHTNPLTLSLPHRGVEVPGPRGEVGGTEVPETEAPIAGEEPPSRRFDTAVRDSTPLDPVGGRLQRFTEFWESLGVPQYLMDIVTEGHTLPFLQNPPPFRGVKSTPLIGPPEKVQVLLDEVQALLSKGAVELVPPGQQKQGWYGHYFIVSKKTGGWRPILNLKPHHTFLRVDSFKMETLRSVTLAVNQGEWLASIDLKDAYFHVPIRQSHRQFLRFSIQGEVYQYKVLPFGLSTSPRVFTKVLAPVIAHLRIQGVHIHPYLDDLLVRAQSPTDLVRAIELTCQVLGKAGYLINTAKSHLTPTQDLVFIGGRFMTDLNAIFLPPRRIRSVMERVSLFRVNKVFTGVVWLKLLGTLASTINILPYARLRMRQIQMYFLARWSFTDNLQVDTLAVHESLQEPLSWWLQSENLSQGSPLCPQHHTHVMLGA